MAHYNNFEELEIYKLARLQCQEIWGIMCQMSLQKDFKLKKQINGSSGSVMNNITEGFGRGGNKEFTQFLAIARGSNNETIAQLQRAYDRKHISEAVYLELRKSSETLGNQLSKFMNYLKYSDKKGSKFDKK